MSDEREPPRLQDTTERSALPLPLPDNEGEPAKPPNREGRRRWRPLSGRSDEPAADAEPHDPEPAPVEPAPIEPEADAATDETDAVPVADPEAPSSPDGGGAEDVPRPDGAPEVDPAFAPPAVEAAFGDAEAETRPEVLIGAAFVGGVALAFILKRLGS